MNMKALLIYNPQSGHHKIEKKLPHIIDELKEVYSKLDVVPSSSKEDFIKCLEKSIASYDDYIICGGDGTINMAVNVVAKYSVRPNLAFLPFGTLNDGVRNLECPSTLKKAIQAIKIHHVKEVDIAQINDNTYFSYCASIGAYSDIPVKTRNKNKKILGRVAYYFAAVPLLFKKVRLKGIITVDNKDMPFETPFIVILNGKKMGGFKINKKSSINDGKIEVLYGRNGLFNSLPQYFINKKKITRLSLDEFSLQVDSEYFWNIDGEATSYKSINIKVLHNFLKIISF